MHIRRTLFALAISLPLVLSACRSSAPNPTENPADSGAVVEVGGARNAVVFSLSVLRTVKPTVRPATLLGIYATKFLADGMEVPVSAALAGIRAQTQLHGLPTEENVDELYVLLEEFGAVLHVDVPDLVNRSDNRAETLDLYATGLQNITERSRRKSEDLAEQLTTLKSRQSEQRKTVSGLDKEVKSAVKAKDFSTAQDRQKDLTDAQTDLTQTEMQMKELTGMQNIYVELLDIADARIAALNDNREVIIAGLKVVNMPGVEDLGVLEGKTKRGSGLFRGL